MVLANSQSRLLDFDLNNQNSNLSGMICGGKITVLLEYLASTRDNVDFFRQLHNAVINRENFTSIMLFQNDGHAVSDIGHRLVFDDGKKVDRCPPIGVDLERMLTEIDRLSTTKVTRFENWQILLEPIHKIKTLYCFGAGHIANPTAHIAALLGFRVVVVDDRAEFANMERFPDASEVRVIDDFNHALRDFHIDTDSFIVILSRS